MQDHAGLAAPLDLAGLREARGAADRNLDAAYGENAERFGFLHWAEQAFAGLCVVPAGSGIVLALGRRGGGDGRAHPRLVLDGDGRPGTVGRAAAAMGTPAAGAG